MIYLSQMPVLGSLGDRIRDVSTSGSEKHQLMRAAVHHVEEGFHAYCCIALQ